MSQLVTLSVYLRLGELELNEWLGHRIPVLLGYDERLRAIEMTTASPPFCVDLGGAYLDRPPDYSPEVWRDWREEKAEVFAANWPAVEQILEEFEDYGIFIADVNSGNIRF